MRFRTPVDEILGTRTAVRVLRTLTRFPSREFTGRELAGEAGVDPSKGNHVLATLGRHGLVQMRGAGRAKLWRMTEQNLLGAPLIHLFWLERRLPDLLRASLAREIRSIENVRQAVLFGSFARGEEAPGSDVDLLLVVREGTDPEDVRRQLVKTRELITATFGHAPTFVIYSESEAQNKTNLALMRNIEREGVVVVGDDPLRKESIDPGRAGIYLQKAQEFLSGMKRSREAAEWNVAGLAAVHAVIAAADALTTRFLKIRSRGQDHEQTSELLRRLPIHGTAEGLQAFLEVVRVKDLVEYEDRMFGEKEAVATAKKAERFVKWARESLSQPGH